MSPSVPLPRHWLPVLLVVAAHAALLSLLRGTTVTPPVVPALPPVVDVMMLPPAVARPAVPAPAPPVAPPVPVPPAAIARPAPAVVPVPAPAPVLPSPALAAPATDAVPAAAVAPDAPAAAAPGASVAAAGGAVDADAGITPPRIDASYRGNAKPPYPTLSRRLGEEGEVELRFLVNADGTVGEVILSKSSRYPRLDQSAMDTVRRWKLVPARRGNEPVAAWYSLRLKFNLEN